MSTGSVIWFISCAVFGWYANDIQNSIMNSIRRIVREETRHVIAEERDKIVEPVTKKRDQDDDEPL
jgi:hypothetical protein